MALEFNQMSKQARWAVVGVVCVVLVGVFYYYSWAPGAAESAQLRTEIETTRIEVQRIRLVAQQLPQLESELSELERQLGVLSSILPEGQEADELLRRLQAAASDSNLDLRRFTNQDPILHDFYAEVPVELDLVGNYHDLARFFDRVSKFARVVTVGQVSIQLLTDGSGGTIQAQCTASTFFFLPETDDMGDPGAGPSATGR